MGVVAFDWEICVCLRMLGVNGRRGVGLGNLCVFANVRGKWASWRLTGKFVFANVRGKWVSWRLTGKFVWFANVRGK